MKALLKLITSEDRARELLAVCTRKGYPLLHKRHQELLTESIIAEGGFSVNFGGYGSYSRLGLGNNFGSKWEIGGLEAPPNKGFAEVDVCFGAGLDADKEKAIAEYIVKQGGSIVEEGEGNFDLCILSATTGDEQNLLELIAQMVDGAKDFLIIGIEEFLEVIPAIKKHRIKTAKLSDELKQLQKQLQERSHDSINSALKALEGRDAEIDLLIQEVTVDPRTGELDRGPKFKGTGPAMEFLDLALMGLLSQAGENSQAAKIRSAIKKLKFEVKVLPRLNGFRSLEELEIILNQIKYDEQTIKAPDLRVFGPMPSLRKLSITNEPGHKRKSLLIQSLDGLDAPALEELEATNIGLESIAALRLCPNLKFIDLSENPDLSGVEALSGCSSIEILRLNDTGIASIEFLAVAKGLAEININDCKNLKSINGIEKLTNLTRLDLIGLHKLTDLGPLLRLDKLEDLRLFNLTAIKELPEFKPLVSLRSILIKGCDALTDVSSLASVETLNSVHIEECPKLRSCPVTWPKNLQRLWLQDTDLSELGACPYGLTDLTISYNGNLRNLEGLSNCRILLSNDIDLTGCNRLQSLSGLNLLRLDAICIPTALTNLDALKRYPGITITVAAESGKDIPETLGDALIELAPKHLEIQIASIYGKLRPWHGDLKAITGIGRVATLTSLDLSHCGVEDITAIASLDKLELLKIKPRTSLSQEIGAAIFNTKDKIEKLRWKISYMRRVAENKPA